MFPPFYAELQDVRDECGLDPEAADPIFGDKLQP